MRTRLERAIDKRDDLKHDLAKWGFAYSPSHKRKLGKKIAKAEAKVQRLQASA